MPRDSLTRERIVQAAVELLDADGIEGLSMRRLGSHLGSGATTVYWHVKNKDDLVVLAGDRVFGDLELPDPDESGWRDAASALVRGFYAMFLQHLWLVPAFNTHLVYGPGVARYVDHSVGVYEMAGFTGPDIDLAVNVGITYALGAATGDAAEASWTAHLRRSGRDQKQELADATQYAREVDAQFPRLSAHKESMTTVDPKTLVEDAFEFGLETILDGLESRLTSSRSAPR